MAGERPPSWIRLEDERDWQRVKRRGGFVVITDKFTDNAKGGPIYHDRGCPWAAHRYFREKVIVRAEAGKSASGEWYWVASERADRGGGARPCERPEDPMNRSDLG
jgi:hypothetical protein